MFFEANKALGDYHKNFDSFAFFKWMSRFIMTAKPWLKDLQYRKIAGTLDEPTLIDFYDLENDQPFREIDLFLDNAAYHHGTTVQLNYKGKEEIAAILSVLDISYIECTPSGKESKKKAKNKAQKKMKKKGKNKVKKITKGKKAGHSSEYDYESSSNDSQLDYASDSDSGSDSDTEAEPEFEDIFVRFKVPAQGKKWQSGFPTLEQVREGAMKAIHVVSPALLKPPWWVLLQVAKEEYGITLNVKFTAPLCLFTTNQFQFSDQNRKNRHKNPLNRL